MTEELMGYIYFYGFWAVGIICCLCALFAIFVVVRAIFFAPKDATRHGRGNNP